MRRHGGRCTVIAAVADARSSENPTSPRANRTPGVVTAIAGHQRQHPGVTFDGWLRARTHGML